MDTRDVVRFTLVETATGRVLDMRVDVVDAESGKVLRPCAPYAPDELGKFAAAYGLAPDDLAVHEDLDASVLEAGDAACVKIDSETGALVKDVDAIREIERAKIVAQLEPLYGDRLRLAAMAADQGNKVTVDVTARRAEVDQRIAELRARYAAL